MTNSEMYNTLAMPPSHRLKQYSIFKIARTKKIIAPKGPENIF